MVTDRGAARGQALASVALPLLFRTRRIGWPPRSFGGRDLCSSRRHLWLEIVLSKNATPCPAPSTALWYPFELDEPASHAANGVQLNSLRCLMAPFVTQSSTCS